MQQPADVFVQNHCQDRNCCALDQVQREYADKYKGHIGECKFFYYSDDGVPLQPAFKCFRIDLNEC